jgi:CheY-like chemotaxis protein
MSSSAPRSVCWNCDENVSKVVQVFLQASRGSPVPLSLCESCYASFYLPLVSNVALPDSASHPTRTVLIVDDDPSIRTFVSMALEGEGFQVDLAANGKEALTKVKKAPPSAIVLDLWMPVMDGPKFLVELRRTMPEPSIPVLAISAFDRIATADALGVEAFLSKPFTLDALVDTVHELMRSTA